MPTIFYNCGPSYTNGIRNPNGTLEEAQNARVYAFTNPDGSVSESLLDNSCKFHDVKTAYAIGKSNESELILKADTEFVSDLIKNFSSFQPVEKVYAAAAIIGFAAKIALYDIPKAIVENIANEIMAWGKQISADTREQTLAELTQSDGTVYYCLKDSEGNFVFNCSSEYETQSVTLDEMMKITSLHQQLKDDDGEVYGETRIDINSSSGISEVTQIYDGEVDTEGVIVGKITQEKLDKFFDLADASYQKQSSNYELNLPDLDSSLQFRSEAKASEVLDHLNIQLNDNVADELDHWFAESEAIRLQAYRWDTADQSLQKLWLNGNENTLAAYDLQSIMEYDDMQWNALPGSWKLLDWSSSFDTPPTIPRLSSDIINDFEHSLSDVDLGLDSSTYSNPDYGYEGWWNSSGNAASDWSNSYIDPLVLKLGGGSVHTTNLQGSMVMFDMAANGTKVRTGWITPDHAFLVRDRNRNGIIDDSSEMFSERTSPKAATGFAALAQLDSNRDGWIDYRDKASKELRLWTDINVDGVTQKGELHGLGEFGITYLAVKNSAARNVYDNGNLILNVNHYRFSNQRGYFAGQLAEVLFNFGEASSSTSIYISDQATAVRTAEGKTIQLLSDKTSQTINASMSGINLLVGGKGDVLNAGNSRQTILIGNGGSTMNGNAGETHFVVNGTGNTVNTGAGESFIEVNGDANTINASKGDVHIDVEGNRNRITIGSHDYVELGGTGNTLSAVGNGSDNEIVISGQQASVNLKNSDIALQDNASATVNGQNNDITLEGHNHLSGKASGGSLMVWGEDNIATISNAFIGLNEGAELQLSGRNDKIVLAGESELVIKGNASGTTVNVFGENNQVTMTGGSLMMAEGAELDLAGRSNTITMLGNGELHASDRGQRVEVYGDDNQAWLTSSTVTEHGSADTDLHGSGNALRAGASRPDQVRRDEIAFDRLQDLTETFWDEYRRELDRIHSESWRDLPKLPTSPLTEALAPADTPWSSADALAQGSPTWLTAGAVSLLNPRPLLTSSGSSGSYGSSGLLS